MEISDSFYLNYKMAVDGPTSTLTISTLTLVDEVCGSAETGRDAVSTPLVAMGTLLVIAASFISCFGVNLQKWAHNRNSKLPVEERQNSCKMWQWWSGLLCMVMGSIFDMAALPFVPLSRVAALGASTMVANILITPVFLKEKLTKHDVIGCILAVTGTIVACLYGAGEEHNVHTPCLLSYFYAPLFLMYGSFVLIALLVLVYFMKGFTIMQRTLVEEGVIEDVLETVWLHNNLDLLEGIPRHKHFVFVTRFGPQFYPSIHAIFAGSVGAQSVMFAKAVLKFFSNAVYGSDDSAAKSVGFTFLFLVPMLTCLFLQITYLNCSLRIYRDALFVLPVYQALWVAMGILSGLIFYQEYREIKHLDAVLFAVGCAISISGLVVLATRKSKTEHAVDSPRIQHELKSPPLLSDVNDIATHGDFTELKENASFASPIDSLPPRWPSETYPENAYVENGQPTSAESAVEYDLLTTKNGVSNGSGNGSVCIIGIAKESIQVAH